MYTTEHKNRVKVNFSPFKFYCQESDDCILLTLSSNMLLLRLSSLSRSLNMSALADLEGVRGLTPPSKMFIICIWSVLFFLKTHVLILVSKNFLSLVKILINWCLLVVLLRCMAAGQHCMPADGYM